MTSFLINNESKEYQIGLKALRKYNMLAYKEIIFNVMPQLRSGKLLGKTKDKCHFKVELPADDLFVKVYGPVYLLYYVEDNIVVMQSIEPFKTFEKFYRKLVSVRDGIPITEDKDLFKIQLFKTMNK